MTTFHHPAPSPRHALNALTLSPDRPSAPLDSLKDGWHCRYQTLEDDQRCRDEITRAVHVEERHRALAETLTVFRAPHGGFGVTTAWEHTVRLPTSRTLTLPGSQGDLIIHVHLRAVTWTAEPDRSGTELWRVREDELISRHTVWPALPGLAYVVAYAEQRGALYAGLCSPR